MNKKALSALVVLIMALAVVPATAMPRVSASNTYNLSPASNPKIMPVNKEINQLLQSNEKEVRLIVAPTKERANEVFKALAKIGRIDPISKPKYQFIVVTVPKDNLQKLKNIKGILAIWRDRTVKLSKPVVEPNLKPPQKLPQKFPVAPDMFLSIYTTGAYSAWNEYGALGDNVTVAVLDTGVDVGHPFLQRTLDGKRKIIDVYDASDAGIAQLYYGTNETHDGYITVNMTVPVYWGAYYNFYGHPYMFTNYTMGTYYVGNITGSEYYLGLLPERYFDLNDLIYGNLSDVYPVLVVNESGNLVTYVDFNLDNDFTDDQPMTLYDETGDYVQIPTTKVDVALARVHIGDMNNTENYPIPIYYGPGIGYAMFMWDSFGHGTHVSGTIAGVPLPNDPVFNGTFTGGYPAYGIAPNAQLMEVKVLPGEYGFGRISWIINGMFYAALHGADVISMSLGGLATYNDGLEDPTIFYVNLITDYFGVTFAIAAGNDGPTTNTVGSPGDSDLAITVGAYRSSLRWQIFYGVSGVADTVASFSSRGPRMDGLLDPDVIAPGEFIFSSLPLWYTVLYGDPYRYYGIWDGTSMATPHVSGAAALIISYAKAHGLNYNPLMIRRALEMSATPVQEATPVDQGFGLIQIDKAIEVFKNLSNETTTYIYGGTTFTGFRGVLGKKKIPLNPAYVEFNSYFYGVFGLPYLYRGVYIRNEFPESVPLYFYPMNYSGENGLWYTESPKMYDISTSDDWIIPSESEVLAGGNVLGSFSIQIDYSKLKPGHIYVGFVYIDDPDTSYIDGFIPVIVDLPLNFHGENHAFLSDTALPGVAKHYFFQIPSGTKEFRVTLKVPRDINGTAMGRTTLMIAKPDGEVVAAYVPGYWFVGPSIPEYTWVIKDPEPGTWEITAYTSTFTEAFTGYNESHYSISAQLSSVTISPQRIHIDQSSPGTIHTLINIKNNNYQSIMGKVYGLGISRMDRVYGMERNVSQDSWDVIGVIPITDKDYYMRVGITNPENPNADLDLYVFYFPTYQDLINFLNGENANFRLYTDQIGPTSYESFEKFMPDPGYYLIAVYGYDTVGYNPISYLFYYQIMRDTGDVMVTPSNVLLPRNQVSSTYLNIKAYGSGTYLGAVVVKDEATGQILDYSPIIVQIGLPKMVVYAMPEGPVTIGQPTKIEVVALDAQSMKPISGETKVVVNGNVLYTDDGVVEFYYTPKSLGDVLKISVMNDNYQDTQRTYTLSDLDHMVEYNYYLGLYQAALSNYYSYMQEAQQALPSVYFAILSRVTGLYTSKAHEYYEKAESLSSTNIQRATYYMKKAYLLQKRANTIVEVFLEKFSG